MVLAGSGLVPGNFDDFYLSSGRMGWMDGELSSVRNSSHLRGSGEEGVYSFLWLQRVWLGSDMVTERPCVIIVYNM